MTWQEQDNAIYRQLDPKLEKKARIIQQAVNTPGKVAGGWLLRPFCGWRSAQEQARLFAKGLTKLKRSPHNHKPARAVDFVWWHPAKGWSWADGLPWHLVGSAAKWQRLSWGGSWRKFVDLPHVELPAWWKLW